MTEQSTGEAVPERWNAVGPKSDVWMDPAKDPRFAPVAELEGERATLLDYLRAYRLDAPPLYWSDDAEDADWAGAAADPAVVADAWRAWRDEVTFAEQFVAGSPDLAIRSPMQDGTTIALREVILHMIEEYARHLGHADLLRERIDGRVGQ